MWCCRLLSAHASQRSMQITVLLALAQTNIIIIFSCLYVHIWFWEKSKELQCMRIYWFQRRIVVCCCSEKECQSTHVTLTIHNCYGMTRLANEGVSKRKRQCRNRNSCQLHFTRWTWWWFVWFVPLVVIIGSELNVQKRNEMFDTMTPLNWHLVTFVFNGISIIEDRWAHCALCTSSEIANRQDNFGGPSKVHLRIVQHVRGARIEKTIEFKDPRARHCGNDYPKYPIFHMNFITIINRLFDDSN